MGLFSKGRKSLGGGSNGAGWFDGNGEVLAVLKSAVYKAKNQQGNEQAVLTFGILAASADTDVVQVGDERAYRWHSGGKYPDSDAAVFVQFILGLAGVVFDESNYPETLQAFGLNPDDYPLDTDRGRTLADLDIDDAVEKLRDQLLEGEGDAWAGKVAKIKLVTKKEGGYTKTFASAIPSAMHEDGELTDKGKALLERQRWQVNAPA